MGEQGRQLIDFCIPCNPYFPTKGMFEELAANLENILRFYPSDADTITGQLARVIGLNPSTIAMSAGHFAFAEQPDAFFGVLEAWLP